MHVRIRMGTIKGKCSCQVENNRGNGNTGSTYHSVASRRMSSLNIGSNSTSAGLIVMERWSCGLVGGAILNDDCGHSAVIPAGALSARVEGRLF